VKRKVRSSVKRKENTLGGSARECGVPERSTDEDRMTNRHIIESRVSNGDTRSSGSRVPKYKI
jgi:hypothetical protein